MATIAPPSFPATRSPQSGTLDYREWGQVCIIDAQLVSDVADTDSFPAH
jgi:hypothetical protein